MISVPLWLLRPSSSAPRRAAAGSPLTWLLALGFVALIDAAITRTWILWAPTSGEHTMALHLVQLGQTYQAARTLFAGTRRPAAERVAILGDSRVWFAAREPSVERELRRLAPDRDMRVDNLAIFGARVGDLEVLARHLEGLDPTLTVLALSGLELLPFDSGDLGQWPQRLLNAGWRDGPVPAHDWSERVDRWARTIWPLYRLRLFARAAIEDRIAPGPPTAPLPDHIASTRAFHDFQHGPRGAAIEAAYQAWRANPTLEAYVAYLRAKRIPQMRAVERTEPKGASVRADDPGPRVLDALLARLTARGVPVLIVLAPENPLLAQDTAGAYHEPGFSDQMAAAVRAVADRHGMPVVDGRRWLPAESFFDFVHVMPDVGGLQTPLAEAILHAEQS